MSLPDSLERAAKELPELANQIRPANGDPDRLLDDLPLDEARRLLGWVIAHEADSAAELIEVWGETEEGANVLLGMSDDGLSKYGAKLMRKARHRLRSRGIEVATPDPAPKPTRRRVPAEDHFEAALLSSPDFRGARVGYLADRHPSGGARLFEIRFDEARGIADFKVYNAGRSKVRGFLRSLSGGKAQRLFDVPREALCALVRRASLAQPEDRPLPSGFVEWRGRLFPESAEAHATPGGLARAELGADLGNRDSGPPIDFLLGGIEDGSVGPWPPSTGWVSEWMDRGRGGVEDLSGTARGEAIDAWLVDVSEALSASTDKALIARHLEELAWVRWQSKAADEAQNLLAAADAVLEEDSIALRVARARVESLFAPFLGELRVVEEMALEDSAAGAD